MLKFLGYIMSTKEQENNNKNWIGPSNPTSWGYKSEENEVSTFEDKAVCSSLLQDSNWKWKWGVDSHRLIRKGGWSPAVCSAMDGAGRYSIKWNKLDKHRMLLLTWRLRNVVSLVQQWFQGLGKVRGDGGFDWCILCACIDVGGSS